MSNALSALAKIAAAQEPTAPSVRVGDRFIKDEAHPYTEGKVKGVHTYSLLCEVTDTDVVGLTYTVVDTIAECDRPSFATKPTDGRMVWFGFSRALAEGRVEVVAA